MVASKLRKAFRTRSTHKEAAFAGVNKSVLFRGPTSYNPGRDQTRIERSVETVYNSLHASEQNAAEEKQQKQEMSPRKRTRTKHRNVSEPTACRSRLRRWWLLSSGSSRGPQRGSSNASACRHQQSRLHKSSMSRWDKSFQCRPGRHVSPCAKHPRDLRARVRLTSQPQACLSQRHPVCSGGRSKVAEIARRHVHLIR